MCSHWSEAKLFKFLKLYKRYECLWNPYSPEYENCDAKSNAFSQILCEMNIFGLTVSECLNQIKHIRETHKQEQQRLESLAFLGGRSYSNLLWYPLMNSMLLKVIQDEEKLNHTTANLDPVIAPKRLPFNSGDQRSQRDSNLTGYGQMTFPWDPNETSTICSPYLSNSNLGDYMNCYSNPKIGMCTPNEHISSCPTCGYSNCCDCFSTNNVGYYNPDNISQIYSSQSQINYQPRTSYNYRNGILEINSAVRIPVSQPLPNCQYSNVIGSIIPEEPEYNLNPISNNHRSEIQTVAEKEAVSTEYCTKSNYYDRKSKVGNKYNFQKILNDATDNNSNPTNLQINKNSTPVKTISWGSKKSKRTKENVDRIVHDQNLLGLFGEAQDSICKSVKHENSITDNNKSLLQAIDQKNLNKDVQHPPRVETKKLSNIEQNIATLNRQQPINVNVKAESMTEASVKVEQTSTVALEDEQQTKKSISTNILQVKTQRDEDSIPTATCNQSQNCQINCELNSSGPRKTRTRSVSNQSCLAVMNDCNGKISNVETSQDVMQESRNIIKRNLKKMVIDFIDETLNKPDQRSTVNAGERLTLKQMAKNLQTLENGNHCTCDDKLVQEDNYQQSQECGRIKFCKKTICWREPIEESLNIIPCKFNRSPVNKTNCNKNLSPGKPTHGTAHCFRMIAGADFGIDNDMKQSNLFHQKDSRPQSESTIISPDCKESLAIAMDKKQHDTDENNDKNRADILNNNASQTSPEQYILGKVKSMQSVNGVALNHSNFEKARHENPKLLSSNDIENEDYPVIIDKLCQAAEQSIDLDFQQMEKDRQIPTMESNLNTKSCKDQMDDLEYCDPRFTLHDMKEIENSVTIHISVNTSESTENEVIDKLVNEITRILRKTLDKNGYAIEKKQFFTKKNLITDDNGEINRKSIGNEAVWKTELRNIIGQLMKHKKIGNSITFKVKTMILPVMNESNAIAERVANLTIPPKTRQKLVVRSMKGPDETESKACNEQLKDLGSDIVLYKANKDLRFKKELFKTEIKRSTGRRNRHIIRRLKNETNTDEMLINDANRIILPYKDHSRRLWKLLKYLVKFRNKFRSIPKKYEKSLRNELHGNKYEIINDRRFEHNHQHTNDYYVAASLDNELPRNRNEDIDVYLCTEISQEDQSTVLKNTDCYYSDSNIPNDVDKNSISTSTTIQDNSHCQITSTINSCSVHETENNTEPDVSEWESFSESEEKVSEIVNHRWYKNKYSHQFCKRQSNKIIPGDKYGLTGTLDQSNRYSCSDNLLVDTSLKQSYPAVYTSTKTRKNTFGYRNSDADKGKLLDTVIQSPDKEYFMLSEANGLNNMPSLRKRCKISDIFSSNYQNIRQTELRNSEEGSKASLPCAEFQEAQEVNQYQMPNASKSEEGESLLEAKLRITAGNQIKSCCTGEKTHSVCTPICDVTSHLRLCAVIKSPNEISTINDRDNPSNNICCCDDMDKLRNAGRAQSKSRIKRSRNNDMIEDESKRLMTTSCQTEPFKKNLDILESQSDVSNQDCRRNSNSSFQVTRNTTYTNKSAAINSTIATKNEDIRPPYNVDHSTSTMIKRVTVQSNTQSVPTSLDIAAFEGESLILEVKMLQPLFTIELKKGHKDPEKNEAPVEQDSCEILKQNNQTVDTSFGQESVIESSSSKIGVISPQQQSIINYVHESTSTNLIKCGVQKMTDQRPEFLMSKNEEQTLSCGTQTSQIFKMGSDSKKGIKVCSNESRSFNKHKKNASTSLEEKLDYSGPDQCNVLLETLRSLENYQNPNSEISSNEFLINNPIACADKAIPQPEENSSDETKSITIETLVSNIETSLQHITDPIICQRLIDTIIYIRDQNQTQNNNSSKEICAQGQAGETLKRTSEKNEMEMQIKSEDDTRPQSPLLVGKGSECQKPCKIVLTAAISGSIEEMVANVKILRDGNESTQSKDGKIGSPTVNTLAKKEVANQISTNGSRVKLPMVEKFYCQNKPRLILSEDKTLLPDEPCASKIDARKKARSKSPPSKSVSKSQILKVDDQNNISYKNQVISNNEQSEPQGNSCLMNATNYSSNEISCGTEEVESDSHNCDLSINYEKSNMTPRLQNDENYESSKYNYDCDAESTEVDISAFANMVASQLRGLSTEAALRSQQRIQTLISNTRLESEKNKKHR